MNTRTLQKRLKELGYYSGRVDGIFGTLTRNAVKQFQSDKGLDIRWPGTVGPKTLQALAGFNVKASPSITYPWVDLAIVKKGLHETRNYSELSKFLKSDGHTLGDPRKLPWCGDFVETCIARTLPNEPLPANPYLARNWLKFGIATKPTFGAVGVFWRGSKNGISGHVGFLVGQDAHYYYVLGGNQSNSVSVAKISKARLLGARWPSTIDLPTINLPQARGGVVSLNEA